MTVPPGRPDGPPDPGPHSWLPICPPCWQLVHALCWGEHPARADLCDCWCLCGTPLRLPPKE